MSKHCNGEAVRYSGEADREDFMNSTNDNINYALILSCEHTNQQGVIDKINSVYYHLFLIVTTLLNEEDFDVPPIHTINTSDDKWGFQQYLALGLAQNILIMCEISDNYTPQEMCTNFYEEAIIYWTSRSYMEGLDIRQQKITEAVPSFNERNELMLTLPNNPKPNLDEQSSDESNE